MDEEQKESRRGGIKTKKSSIDGQYYGMGHKKFPLKKTMVQIKICISCLFCGTNFCVF